MASYDLGICTSKGNSLVAIAGIKSSSVKPRQPEAAVAAMNLEEIDLDAQTRHERCDPIWLRLAFAVWLALSLK